MRTVSRLSIAPVKSMALVHPDEIDLQPWGAVGNRVFHWVDPDGRLVGGAQLGTLVQVRACHEAATDVLTLTFPDGSVATGPGDDLGDAIVTDFWGRPAPSHHVRGPFSQMVSAFLGRPLLLARSDEPGAANDADAASILSTASVAELAARSGSELPRDARRFRMLIEVDGCEHAHEEDEWMGRRVRVGDAVVRVTEPVPRCAFTTYDPGSGHRDFRTLHAIKDYRGVRAGRYIDFGVLAEVLQPGMIRLADPMQPLQD
jgi:uncharacterized protein YcbX